MQTSVVRTIALTVVLALAPSGILRADECNTLSHPSRCQNDFGGIGGYNLPTLTFPINPPPLRLNLARWLALGPAELPPRSTDPRRSSLALISSDWQHRLGPPTYPERVLQADLLDLATGIPLIQESDFELPFGSAVFRHIRTYSDNPTTRLPETILTGSMSLATDQFWDWNGQYWMMSESPILLIDAAFEQLDPLARNTLGLESGRRICYFIADAHHTIPFIKKGTEWNYYAPPWFDARLGTSTSTVPNSTVPSEYYVWLDRGSIKYTFETHIEDMPTVEHECSSEECSVLPPCAGKCSFSAHEAPPHGLGVPYYGLLKRIEDRFGNRVEIEHVASSCPLCDPQGGTAVCQNCNAKGQIASVRLFAPGATTPEWTLIYTHRPFSPFCADYGGGLVPPGVPPKFWTHWLPHALHSIHVYRGAPALPVDLHASATLDPQLFYGHLHESPTNCLIFDPATSKIESFDEYESIPVEALRSLPAEWTLRVSYMYEEADADWYQAAAPNTQYAAAFENHSVGRTDFDLVRAFPTINLLKARVTKGAGPSDIGPIHRDVFYRYDPLHPDEYSAVDSRAWNRGTGLRAIFSGKTVDRFGIPGNAVLALDNQATLQVVDPATQAIEDRPLFSLADVQMRNVKSGGEPGFDPHGIASSLGLDPDTTYYDDDFRRTFVDRRDGREHYYLLTYFRTYPPDVHTPHPPCGNPIEDDQSTLHFPYHADKANAGGIELVPIPFTVPFYTAVVDEVVPEPGNELLLGGGFEIKQRRAVGINVRGTVLWEELWTFEEEGGVLVAKKGYRSTYKYDEYDRVTQIGSKGHGALPSTEQDTQGLVQFFEYPPPTVPEDPNTAPRDFTHMGVQQGWMGEKYYTARVVRGVSGRPELVTEEARFRTPQANPAAMSDERTTIQYEFDPPEGNEKLKRKTILRSASAPGAGSPILQPRETFVYDDQGREVLHAVGSVGPGSPGTPLVQYGTVRTYDTLGRPLSVTEDAGSNSELGFERLPSDPILAAPLNHVTAFEYDDVYGLRKVTQPNGREQHIVFVKDSTDPYGTRMFQWVYRDVTPAGAQCHIGSPIEVSILKQGTLERKVTLRVNGPAAYPPQGAESWPAEDEITSATPEYGLAGQVTGLTTSGGSTSISATLMYHATGQIEYQKDPDGTITRTVYDDRGRVERIFRGTHDTDDFWGWSPNPTAPPDNMTLIEKRYYGSGVTNADLVTRVRTYAKQVPNQYNQNSQEDQVGAISDQYHDWRMREVLSVSFSEAGQPVSHTFTWYDHLDRPRFVATFQGDAPAQLGAVDPRFAAPNTPEPAALDILSLNPKPISLSESIYNDRGLTEETRSYRTDLSPGNPPAPQYLSTFTFYDHADRPIESRSAGAPIQQTVYDAKGRTIVSRSLVDADPEDIELADTTTAYDADGRALSAVRRERRHDAASAALQDNESILSYTHNWFDQAGRTIATANYGTAAAGFVTNTTPPVRGENPPPPSAALLVSLNTYDSETGRLLEVQNPNGSVTRYEYDGLGRQVLLTENAEALDPNETRRTAYLYEDGTGRLLKMAAVQPQHNAGSIPNFASINWEATDASLQVTEFLYSAAVYDPSGLLISENESWISEVRYPDDLTGQPSTANTLKFTYYPDGAVASRLDSKGVLFQHWYDGLGRRTLTHVTEPCYAPPLASWMPTDRVQRVEYTYFADGKLNVTTARSGPSAAAPILAQNQYDYDDARNLAAEWQQHGGAIHANTIRIGYGWEFDQALQVNRLAAMTLPARTGASAGRTLTLDYGAPGSVDDRLSRVTKVSDSALGDLVSYAYMGTSRRIGTLFSAAAVAVAAQSLAAPGVAPGGWPGSGGSGYPGLDRFGRTADLCWTVPASAVGGDHRYQYTYDASGNRLTADVQQAVVNGVASPTDRDYEYGYDALDRLISSALGTLAGGVVSSPERESTWSLDTLGNWTGPPGGGLAGLTIVDSRSGPTVTSTFDHAVFASNELDAITFDPDGPGGAAPQTDECVYDPAGNLVLDGTYFYLYDGFNRLIQVMEAGTLTSGDFLPCGVLDPEATPGDILVRYAYDGLGRLMRRETALAHGWPEPWAPWYQVEDYYYDGVRRVQERIECYPWEVIQALMVGALEEPPNPLYKEREYVWGPEYVDEAVCQIDTGDDYSPLGRPLFYVQDANYNVAALLAGGPGAGGSGSPTGAGALPAGTTLEQYVYDPYGQVIAADRLDPGVSPNNGYITSWGPAGPPINHLGHQGLFFDGFVQNVLKPELDPNTRGIYYNRNRHYDPGKGRFLQREINGTGSVLLDRTLGYQRALAIAGEVVTDESAIASGHKPFIYQASNPLAHTDATGLIENHLYPLYLGGPSKGPGIDMSPDSHNIFHKAIHQMLETGYGQDAREVWKTLDDGTRRSVLISASGAAGVDVTDSRFVAALDDAFAKATPGFKQKRMRPTMINVNWVDGSKSYTRGKAIPGISKLDKIGKALSVVGVAMIGARIWSGIQDPHVRDMALTTYKYRVSGQISMLDEVFILHDLYQLTGDPFAASAGWEFWQQVTSGW